MKYALLDTDFISKTHTVRLDDEHHLIDRVLDMPDYAFFCNEQTLKELRRHNMHAPSWLSQKIEDGVIRVYSDEKIIEEMGTLYRNLCLLRYAEMLKTACNAFGADCFSKNYGRLDDIDLTEISKEDFINELKDAESAIGGGNNLGEIKCFVLLQWLHTAMGDHLYYFCSDDKDARNGVLGIGDMNVRCVTLVSSLLRIINETNSHGDVLEPYAQAMLGYFDAHNRKTIRVVEASAVGRVERVDCRRVLREIFEDRFIELPNGFLKYKP